MSSKQNENVWQSHITRIALNTVTHPVEYAKVLIQVRAVKYFKYYCKTIIVSYINYSSIILSNLIYIFDDISL